jgi:hypothetical protein
MTHYHGERNHQGLENQLLQPLTDIGELHHPVRRRQRLGGMLSYYYHRQAARTGPGRTASFLDTASLVATRVSLKARTLTAMVKTGELRSA